MNLSYLKNQLNLNTISLPNLWCIHSYYTLTPYAPDGSQRILIAGADLNDNTGNVYILSSEGKVLDKFGMNKTNFSFFHTGFWQSWSPNGDYGYYQSGTLSKPKIIRRHIKSSSEIILDGDMEGCPPFGEPIISGLMGMLYAAGYGDGKYNLLNSPIPFYKRNNHGLFQYNFNLLEKKLLLSTSDILENHPKKDMLFKYDKTLLRTGTANNLLTLMTYCVRWNYDGTRFLFYFGNHCVDKRRKEPRLSYIFTSDRYLKEIHLALDLSFNRQGLHWSWHPDGEHLIGYGPDPHNESKMCLCQVHYTGENYKKISYHSSGGHPSISPTDYTLLVTDDTREKAGKIVFIDIKNDKHIKTLYLPRTYGSSIPSGRNPFRICHHPVFNKSGTKVLFNTLPNKNAVLCEFNLKNM